MTDDVSKICFSASVEIECPPGAVSVPMCSEQYRMCIPSDQTCDGFAHCTGGLDESLPRCENGMTGDTLTAVWSP